MAERPTERNTEQDLAYLIFAVAGIAIMGKIWSSRIKPWLVANVGLGEGEALIRVGGLGITVTDIVGVLAITSPLIVLTLVIRHQIKVRRRTAERNRKAGVGGVDRSRA